jgi:hypothetical protein
MKSGAGLGNDDVPGEGVLLHHNIWLSLCCLYRLNDDGKVRAATIVPAVNLYE